MLLCALSFFGNPGILTGLAAAIIFQISAARWFVRFLRQIATEIDRPDLANRIEVLRCQLNAFAFSLYGAGLTALIVCISAVLVILMSFGLMIPIAIPFGLMVIVFVLLVAFGLYLRVAWGYSGVIKSIAQAIDALNDDPQAEAIP
ncbi:MAG: hypothetical protein RIS70_986 [Planctomycetota bacterium]